VISIELDEPRRFIDLLDGLPDSVVHCLKLHYVYIQSSGFRTMGDLGRVFPGT
jgi:hypothetical protein